MCDKSDLRDILVSGCCRNVSGNIAVFIHISIGDPDILHFRHKNIGQIELTLCRWCFIAAIITCCMYNNVF